jgi:malonyl-CoA O-methyltransferase
MTTNKHLDQKQTLANAFSAAAHSYDQSAFVEQEIGSRLLERLMQTDIKPQRILDLGCGTGYFSQQLQNLFPQASIIGIDLALGMVKYATNNLTKSNLLYFACADAEQLPFADRHFDLIFSNCCLMLLPNLSNLFAELHRVLKLEGLLLFSAFGPDTLQELATPATWLDMHYYGDALLQAQFKDPVVDREIINFNYDSLTLLLQDLNGSGAYEIDLTVVQQLPNINQPCTVNFEVIYGLAWGKEIIATQYKDATGKIFIPINTIKCL